MKPKRKTKRAAGKKVVLERWTVDRLDRDSGMARVEAVRMRANRLTDKLLKQLSSKGLEVELEDLSFWNTRSIKFRKMEIAALESRLGFKSEEEKKTLSENMVFWVINPDAVKKKLEDEDAAEAGIFRGSGWVSMGA